MERELFIQSLQDFWVSRYFRCKNTSKNPLLYDIIEIIHGSMLFSSFNFDRLRKLLYGDIIFYKRDIHLDNNINHTLTCNKYNIH